MSGAAFPLTFDQEFTGNIAPPLSETVVSTRGRITTEIEKR